MTTRVLMSGLAVLISASLWAQSSAPILRPDATLTPGAIDPTLTSAALCAPSFRTKTKRDVTDATRQRVFDRYRVSRHGDRFEIDHLVSIELGGSNDVTNLWPQSYTTQPFNATVKDGLENRLHHLVCTQGADKIDLQTAQTAMRMDWIAAYKRYMCAGNLTLTAIEAKACEALQ